MISPNTTLLFCKASPQGSNSVITRLSISHWDIPESSVLSEKASDDYIWMQNLSTGRVGRDTEEMYRHGQVVAAAVAGPCTSTVLSISMPVGMWWVHIVQWAALITTVHNSPMSVQRKRPHGITGTQTQRLTLTFSWLCRRIEGPSSWKNF